MQILFVALGGAIGSIGRYLIGAALRTHAGSFPYATLLVNVTGCFLLGLCMALFETRETNETLRIALTVGVLGGFTTFSAFGYETFALMRSERELLAMANVASNVLLGLGAVWLGRALVASG